MRMRNRVHGQFGVPGVVKKLAKQFMGGGSCRVQGFA